MELLVVFAPFALPIVAAYLFWLGLHPASRIMKRFIILGLLFLAPVYVAVNIIARMDGLVAVGAFFIILFAAPTAFLAGVMLAAFLKGKRKLASLVIAVLFPVTLFFSMTEATKYSVAALRRDYGGVIAQSIEQYDADNGTYPETLQQLVPIYLDELRDSGTMWGWLYTTTDDTFSFGFVSGVERFGYFVYAYNPDTEDWDFLTPSENVFDIPPTPSGMIFPLSTIVPTTEG